MSRRVVGVFAWMLIATVACGDGGSDPAYQSRETPTQSVSASGTTPAPTSEPASDDETPSPSNMAWASCEHPAGVVVQYPEGWHVNDGSTLPACIAFDPQPFDVPESHEFFGSAVLLSVENFEFRRAWIRRPLLARS